MTKFLYGTNFQNEHTASGPPSRALINNNSATILAQSVDASGYNVSLRFTNTTSSWELCVPSIFSTLAFHLYCEIELHSSMANIGASIFGVTLLNSVLEGTIPISAGVYKVLIVKVPGQSEVLYINGRLINVPVTVTDRLCFFKSATAPAGNVDAAFTVKTLLTWEADTPIFSVPTLASIEWSLINSVDWSHTGNSFRESVDKNNTITATPNVATDRTGSEFVIEVPSSGELVLLEAAGYIEETPERYGITVKNVNSSNLQEVGPLSVTQGPAPALFLNAGQVKFSRTLAPFRAELVVTSAETLTISAQDANLNVYWGDDFSTVMSGNTEVTHTFLNPGTYKLLVYGTVSSLRVSGSALRQVLDWGNLEATHYAFYVAANPSINLSKLPSYLPDTVTSLQDLLRSSAYNGTDLSSWDISAVTNLNSAFRESAYNNPLSWEVAQVSNFDYAFYGATTFNQDLSYWDVAHIAEEPVGFSEDTISWLEPKPWWGLSRGTHSVTLDFQDWRNNAGADGNYAAVSRMKAYTITGEEVPASSLTYVASENYSSSYTVATINKLSGNYWCSLPRTAGATTPPTPRVTLQVNCTTKITKLRIGLVSGYVIRLITATSNLGTATLVISGVLVLDGGIMWVDFDIVPD